MKLIIDIDEDYYKAICERAERFGIGSCVLTPSQKIIFNGIPLEDIKADMQKYIAENKNSYDLYVAGCGDGAYHALAILDKHIGEINND